MNDRDTYYSHLLRDFSDFCSEQLQVLAKTGGLVSLKLNPVQESFNAKLDAMKREKGYIRVIVLKGRRMGMSTVSGARFFHQSIQHTGLRTYIMAQDAKTGGELFEMVKNFHEGLDSYIQPTIRKSNAKELAFESLNSKYSVGTANAPNAGRGLTTHNFHGSEVAFWDNADGIVTGVLESINLQGTEVVLESTANGMGNFFHETWLKAEAGENNFLPIFFAWFDLPEYRLEVPVGTIFADDEIEYQRLYGVDDEQLYWRREKLRGMNGDIDKFKQEYPSCSSEAFLGSGDGIMTTELVQKSMSTPIEHCDKQGSLVVGIDPAGVGKDRTAMVWRRNNAVLKIETWNSTNESENIGRIIHHLNDKTHGQFDRAFIDVGFDAGITRSVEEIFGTQRITRINFGSKPMNTAEYTNKRAEMWDSIRQWLRSTDNTHLPHRSDLMADLTAPAPAANTSGKFQLESKKDMKSRGIPSPDVGDALALTFAFPVISEQVRERRDMKASQQRRNSPFKGRR